MIYLIIFIVCFGIATLLVGGIEDMKENHPDYNGEDFLDEDK